MRKQLFSLLLRSSLCFAMLSGGVATAQMYDPGVYQQLVDNPAAFRQMMLENPGLTVNLKGADLSGLDLSGIRFVGSDLSYADLSNTNLKEADLTQVNLIGAKLTNTNFHRANLSYANLNKTNATGAQFKEATMKNTVVDYLLIQEGNALKPAYIDANGSVAPIAK